MPERSNRNPPNSPLPRGKSSRSPLYEREARGDFHPGGDESTRCELCQRGVDRYTVHHLIPRARGGRFGPTANLCPTCHRQVHALFSEATLARELNSVELLMANPEIASYLTWVRNRKPASHFRVRRANGRR